MSYRQNTEFERMKSNSIQRLFIEMIASTFVLYETYRNFFFEIRLPFIFPYNLILLYFPLLFNLISWIICLSFTIFDNPKNYSFKERDFLEYEERISSFLYSKIKNYLKIVEILIILQFILSGIVLIMISIPFNY